MKQMKRRNARPFLCTYSSACPPPHPWVDQGSDLAPTCSPCLSPHQLTTTPLISFPLSDSSSEREIVLRTGIQIPQLFDLSHSKFKLRYRHRHHYIRLLHQSKIGASAKTSSQISPLSSYVFPEELLPPLWCLHETKMESSVQQRSGEKSQQTHSTDRNQYAEMGHGYLWPRIIPTKNPTFRPEDLNKIKFWRSGGQDRSEQAKHKRRARK